MRATVALVLACGLIAFAAVANADPSEYGIDSVAASRSTDKAGDHPDFTTEFALNTVKHDEQTLPATTRTLVFDLSPGLLGNPNAFPKCSAAQLVGTDVEDPSNASGCPQDSQVGVTEVKLSKASGAIQFLEPVYNMSPAAGEPARLGFMGQSYPIMIDLEVLPERDYAVTARAEGISSLIPLLSASTTLWAVPADESHDAERITPYEATHAGGVPQTPNGKRHSGLSLVPFMSNPTRCGVPGRVDFTATPYALPDLRSTASAFLSPTTGCGALDFSPGISFNLSERAADSPTGMEAELTLPQDSLQFPNLLVESHLRRAVVTLPEGLTLNPAAADGLGACSETEVGLISENPIRFNSAPPSCPESSKVGTAEIETPLLPDPLEGSLYVARQVDNPFGTLLAGYLVAQGGGVTVKLAGRFDIDPQSRRITATFDDNPQAPFDAVRLHLKEGPRGVLITPPTCGSYRIESRFSPWSAVDPANQLGPTGAVAATSAFALETGPGGGPCPSGQFAPELEAASATPLAGAYSTLGLRLWRGDGDERLGALRVDLPRGLVGKLAGIPYCPKAAIEAAASRTALGQGAVELNAPSCPATSEVGKVIAGVGAGPTPLQVRTGRAYLAGPYKGAPLSLVTIAPAFAGPFDLGVVVVRSALDVNPVSLRVTAQTDPLPTELHGIPLDLREVRIVLDRSRFALNPTSCEPLSFAGQAISTSGASAPLSAPFQVDGCRGLGFKPRLSLRLRGGTERGSFPALRSVYRPRKGDANLRRLVLRLPHSEFIEQGHFRVICTRVQFAAGSCPKRSVYGHVRVSTPLLDKPLKGPVYLRSSNHELPDVVFDLHGVVDAEVSVHIDSVNGGLRATVAAAPDVPVSEVVLEMQGGDKGLIVNSTDICRGVHRANLGLNGQNGRQQRLRPALKATCGKQKRHRRTLTRR